MTTARSLGLAPLDLAAVLAALADALRTGAPSPFLVALGYARPGETDAARAARGAGRLHVHRLPQRLAGGTEAAAGPAWALLRRMRPAAPLRPGHAGLLTVRAQLVVSVDPAATTAPDRALAAVHERAYAALQDAAISGDAFAATTLVEQTGAPTPPDYDDDGRLFSTAYYAVAARPTAP